jgi:hypothetical protein
MNLASNKEPPLPNPLLHKYVEERELERREGFMGSMGECVRGILSLSSPRTAGRGWPQAGRGVRSKAIAPVPH